MWGGIIALIKSWVKKHVHFFAHLKGMKTSSDGRVSAALRTWLVQLPHTCGSYWVSFLLCGSRSHYYCLCTVQSILVWCISAREWIYALCCWSQDNNMKQSLQMAWRQYWRPLRLCLHWGRLGWFIHDTWFFFTVLQCALFGSNSIAVEAYEWIHALTMHTPDVATKPLSLLRTRTTFLWSSSTPAVLWKHQDNYPMYSAIAYYRHNMWSHWFCYFSTLGAPQPSPDFRPPCDHVYSSYMSCL